MPLISAGLTTSHRCRGACQEGMEDGGEEGWLGGDQGGEEKRGEGEGGFPSACCPYSFAELSCASSKEHLKKNKLKIDAASKHPAPVCASAWPCAPLR